MAMRQLHIVGSGKYLPARRFYSDELNDRFYCPPGWIQEKTHIEYRSIADVSETSSSMGAKAIRAALDAANMTPQQLDLIIAASSLPEQPLPGTGVFIHKALGLEDSGIPCFDVNSTCLSFLTALDISASLLATHRYQHIAIVSTEIASKGINWNHFESATLFGDGAAAVIVRAGSPDAGIRASLMRTYSAGATHCQVKAGGTKLNVVTPPDDQDDYLFEMDGKAVYKLAAKYMPVFMTDLLTQAELSLDDIDVVIPHQASPLALDHLHRRLGIPTEKLMNIIRTHGNQVAASIPTTLHEAIVTKRLVPGQTALLIGTAAGLSIGGIILKA